MIKRSHLKSGKVVSAAGVAGSSASAADAARKRDGKGEEKKEKRDKKVFEILAEHERKIAGKTNCL